MKNLRHPYIFLTGLPNQCLGGPRQVGEVGPICKKRCLPGNLTILQVEEGGDRVLLCFSECRAKKTRVAGEITWTERNIQYLYNVYRVTAAVFFSFFQLMTRILLSRSDEWWKVSMQM